MTRLQWPFALGIVIGASLTVTAVTQDPLTVSPAAYRLQFENAWVRVVRVHYGPKVLIAPHFHTEQASAYVYLNDGGPIVFKHEGLPYADVTRPATKAGSFRIYKGLKEVHSVENPTDTPSDFLRVEFKTEPIEEATLRGKFFREPELETSVVRRQFENGQIRISRVLVAPGETLRLPGGEREPALFVSLTPTQFVRLEPLASRNFEVGESAWVDADTAASVQGMDALGAEVLRFEFKTPPAVR